MSAAPALNLVGVKKTFGRLEVLVDVTMSVAAGERHGILGPNGAGKTTLFNVITGELPATAGTIEYFGNAIGHLSVNRRAALGLCRTFQTTTLFPKLTAVENLLIALQAKSRGRYQMLLPRTANKALVHEAKSLLDGVGLADRGDNLVVHLSHGEQRQIEVLMALAQKPKVLLLDEPTAGLAPGDIPLITRMLRELSDDVTMIIIEHDMGVVFDLCNRLTVLHYGTVKADGTVEEVRANPMVQEIYLGGKL